MRVPLVPATDGCTAPGVLRTGDGEARQGSSECVDLLGQCLTQAVCFTVPGNPVGKQRARSRIAKSRDGRQFVTHYTPNETVSYENLIKSKAETAMAGRPLIAGPVELMFFAFVLPPASWSLKKQRAALAGEVIPTTKPDADNILKALCDGMNGVVWNDDKQVADLRMSKRYAATPGLVVEVRAI